MCTSGTLAVFGSHSMNEASSPSALPRPFTISFDISPFETPRGRVLPVRSPSLAGPLRFFSGRSPSLVQPVLLLIWRCGETRRRQRWRGVRIPALTRRFSRCRRLVPFAGQDGGERLAPAHRRTRPPVRRCRSAANRRVRVTSISKRACGDDTRPAGCLSRLMT